MKKLILTESQISRLLSEELRTTKDKVDKKTASALTKIFNKRGIDKKWAKRLGVLQKGKDQSKYYQFLLDYNGGMEKVLETIHDDLYSEHHITDDLFDITFNIDEIITYGDDNIVEYSIDLHKYHSWFIPEPRRRLLIYHYIIGKLEDVYDMDDVLYSITDTVTDYLFNTFTDKYGIEFRPTADPINFV